MNRRSFAKRIASFLVATKFSMLFDVALLTARTVTIHAIEWCDGRIDIVPPIPIDCEIVLRDSTMWVTA